jgi:hypothetical protein
VKKNLKRRGKYLESFDESEEVAGMKETRIEKQIMPIEAEIMANDERNIIEEMVEIDQ